MANQMANQTTTLERKRLLELADEYRKHGYEVMFQPSLEDLPDALKPYRPDMLIRRGNEVVIIEVKSRTSLNPIETERLRSLATVIEKQPGWRFELVMTNPDDIPDSPQTGCSLQKPEIELRLRTAKELMTQNLELAVLYIWALVEATLRLVVEQEGLSLQRFEPLYLIKQLTTEGIVSRSEYQLLMNALSWRNAIAHGFKPSHFDQASVEALLPLTEQLLNDLRPNLSSGH
jgi:hypothetical protein